MTTEIDIAEEASISPIREGSEEGDGDGNSQDGGSQLGDLEEQDEEGTELNNDAQAFKEEIGKIRVEAPSMYIVQDAEFTPEDYPDSYRENTHKEKLVLAFAENFRRQYVHLYRDRKPLLLNPTNECSVEKFVCTSLKPTLLQYEELYDWDGAAEFVSDYLNFETLEPPYELPRRLLSSPTVLKRQKGNCFEYSMLLCSLLLGAGYDAYVVSGYATRETCLMDETREICPLLKKKEEMPKLLQKYFVPRDTMRLQTKLEHRQDAAADVDVFDLGGDPAQELYDKYVYQHETIARIKARRKADTLKDRSVTLTHSGKLSKSTGGSNIASNMAISGVSSAKFEDDKTGLKIGSFGKVSTSTESASEPVEVKQEVKKKEHKKYTVKPAKDLRSKYELKMAERQLQDQKRQEEQRIKDEEEKLADMEKPAIDTLYGLRVHAWVLVLEGKREVPESFFIEPFTGISHPVDSSNYLGIESLWNHQNYWVNMQDCSEGCKNLKYDLGDCAQWEFMFPSNDKPMMLNAEDSEDLGDLLHDEQPEEEVEKHMDIPPSWIIPIKLEPKDFHMRCPMGKKTKYYKRAKLEKYAHYLMKDGLISRLSVYEDKNLKDLVQVKEFYAHRQDRLQEKIINHKSGWITETFSSGRNRPLKEHQYKASASMPENDRTMVFYHEARMDGLKRRVETPTSMTEHFVDRDDYLFYRYVQFNKRPKIFGPAEAPTPRPIVKMVEKYHRNQEIAANENISELVFLVAEERIQVTYHTEDSKVSASTREFIIPSGADEKGTTITMSPDMHITFQVDPAGNSKKQVELYQMLLDLMKAQEKCKERVRESENEVKEVLSERYREESASQLEISVYDTMRNEKAKRQRKELERMLSEEKKRKDEMDLDYLAPFLAQIRNPDNLNLETITQLKEKCLKDLKARLIEKADLIQDRFEKEKQKLQKKQTEYQKKQVSMTKEEEDKYLIECSELMFRIHILEVRLSRHKEMAPFKFRELQEKLQSDPRLKLY